MTPHEEHALALSVRTMDYERFLAIQLAPAVKRAALYAITAFAAELARIPHLVREKALGHIRFAWWREGVEQILAGGKPTTHPVLIALAEVFAQCPAALAEVLAMIDAEEEALETGGRATRYAEPTHRALNCAWATVLDEAAAKQHREAVMNLEVVNFRTLPYSLRPLRLLARFAQMQKKSPIEGKSNMMLHVHARIFLVIMAIKESFF